MSRFLPPGGPYPPVPRDGDFTTGSADVLEHIGSAMDVRQAHTHGRIPSPVTRAYMFYANLFLRSIGDADDRLDDDQQLEASRGRKALQDEARRTLRGLLATFALRDVLDLEIRFKRIRLQENGTDKIGSVLVPALKASPGGDRMWNPVELYTVRANGSAQVLAGRSPLTGIYPAATPPSNLSGLYWYEYDAGEGAARWYDPTSDALGNEGQFYINNQTRLRVQQLMKVWLVNVLSGVTRSDLEGQDIGMESRDAQRLLEELRMWRDELYNVEVPSGVEVTTEPIADGYGDVPLPILSFTVRASAKHLWSDLPMHNGRLIVTHEQLLDQTTRLYGRHFGSSKLEEVVKSLQREGDNLGRALDMGENAIPVPFISIDELFTPNLTVLTSFDPEKERRGGLSAEWRGLEVDIMGTTEYYLIPLEPEILEIMDPETLMNSLGARLSNDGRNYIVELDFGGVPITKLYSTGNEGRHRLDGDIARDEFDWRLFPKYDLDTVRHLIADEGSDERGVDETYYARLRLSPQWGFRRTDPFAVQEGTLHKSIQDTAIEIGDETQRSGQTRSTGTAVFYSMTDKPDGFFVPDRGFCLLDLADPRTSGLTPSSWSVGIDFGTSNTCIAYRNSDDTSSDPEILQLPTLTTTLLERPNYRAKFGHVFEGGSAALDFFYNFANDEDELMSQLYFPTQLLTQQSAVEDDETFDLKNGLIYFDNISLADPALISLIQGFPQVQTEVVRRFRLEQDIKWEKKDWLRVFMHHLRKQVVLTAAAKNARVESLNFSYPKSFNLDQQDVFHRDLKMAWEGVTPTQLNLSSESEAARDYVLKDNFNQHIIFDIGGGTTDIIAFDNQEPIFQTSFKLAAGQVNRYVVESPEFRRKFVQAIEESAKRKVLAQAINQELVEKFQEPTSGTQEGEIVLQLWLGLLQHITDVDPSNSGDLLIQILSDLRTQAEPGDSIQGFFLSNALLFGGLAFYTGQLLRVASEGKFGNEPFDLLEVTVELTGNGSRLYNTLSHSRYPFAEVVKHVFRAGAGLDEDALDVVFKGIFDYKGMPAPKVTVALGLLRNTMHDNLDDVYVANIAAEQGFPGPDGTTTSFDTPLSDLYQEVFKKNIRFDPPREAPPNLSHFLDAMGNVMPYGRHGQFRVIPEAQQDWADVLRTDVYRRAQSKIKNRGSKNAQLSQDLDSVPEANHPALEPLFIAEIVGLLDTIRDQYAR